MHDIAIIYHAEKPTTASIEGLTVPGKSIMRSNFSSEKVYDMPDSAAFDYAEFFQRKGLKVKQVHQNNLFPEKTIRQSNLF